MNVKYLAVAAALIGAASFTSCSNQEDAVAEIQTKTTCPKVINVKVDGGTRAVMGEGNKPMWTKYSFDPIYGPQGDQLDISSVNADGQQTGASFNCTNPETGEFTLDTDLGWSRGEGVGPYIVYYGTGSFSWADMDNKTISPSQPGNINPVPSDISYAIMACCTEDLNNCTLKNLSALLKVTVPADANVNYISLEHYGAEEATYSFETKSWGDYSYETHTRSFIIGNFAYPSMYASTADDIQPIEAGTYYFPLYPQTLSSAENPFCFKLTYTCDKWDVIGHNYASAPDSFFTTKTKTGSVTLEAGKIYDLGTLTVDF